ncbi:hypothetical protein BC332_03778 [Capsicum chinense]|nr:hypothetical protein BC332_03778 [Capsicum chinense]
MSKAPTYGSSNLPESDSQRHLVKEFRAVIQLQFDFHRAIYNLGTILYGLAGDMSRTGGVVNTKEISPNELYCQAVIYVGTLI